MLGVEKNKIKNSGPLGAYIGKKINAGERCELEGGSLFGKKGFSKSTDSLSIVTGKTFMKWRQLVKGRSFGISLISPSVKWGKVIN